MIYLASPYSHTDYHVRKKRFDAAVTACAKLIKAGECVFSPIVHSHPIAIAHDLPGDWQFWKDYDLRIIPRCDRFMVLMLDGYIQSRGVQAEIEEADRLGMKIEWLEASA